MASGAAGAAAAGAAAAANRRPPIVRIAPPASYQGAGDTIDQWLSALGKQFEYYQMADPAEQLRMAAAHLDGAALDWYQHLDAKPASWPEFVSILRGRFQPVTAERAARERIHNLTQGKSSINEYVATFRQLLVAIPTMDASSQMYQFVRGLRPQLQLVHEQAQPATLAAAISLAVRIGSVAYGSASGSGASSAMDLGALSLNGDGDQGPGVMLSSIEHAELLALAARGRGNGSGLNGRGAQGASGGFRGPRGLPVISGLSEDKVRKYLDEGRCFGCHALGHRSNVCPKRAIGADGKVSWTAK